MANKRPQEEQRPTISLTDDDQSEAKLGASGSSLFSKSIETLDGGTNPSDPLSVQRALKMGFLITLALGTACIFLFKDSGFWNILICICVMGFYWRFAAKRIVASVTAKAVFADSFYYLGFLFTFIALISTMIGLSASDFRPELIVGQIGPALATTVLGMAVRIYVTQFDAITSEPDVEVLTGLGELSSNLSSAITELQKMISEHIKISQTQHKSNAALSKKFSEQVEMLDFAPALESLKSFGSEINLLSTQVKLLTDVTGQTESGVAKMTSSMFRVTTEMDKTSNEFSRYQSIKKDFDEARESLLSVSEDALSLQEVIKDTVKVDLLGTVSDLDARASEIDRKLDEADSKIDRLGNTTEDAQSNLDKSLSKLYDSTEVISGLTEQMNQLEELTVMLTDTKSTVQSLRLDVKEINSQISVEIDKARAELSKTSKVAAEILRLEVEPIRNAITTVSKDFDPIEKNLQDLDKRVKKSVTDVLEFLNK
ncbi:MAG: hypothetical protein VB914_06220 [Porticoccaceae bacterium]